MQMSCGNIYEKKLAKRVEGGLSCTILMMNRLKSCAEHAMLEGYDVSCAACAAASLALLEGEGVGRASIDFNASVACVVGTRDSAREACVCVADVACVAASGKITQKTLRKMPKGTEKYEKLNVVETSSYSSYEPVVTGNFLSYSPEVIGEACDRGMSTPNYCKHPPRVTKYTSNNKQPKALLP